MPHIGRFVDNQLANKKTRRVLEAAFGEEWTEKYMTKVGSVVRLYRHWACVCMFGG